MAIDPCPWLGTAEDRQVRHAEAFEAHLCYARRRPAELDLRYQEAVCLIAVHRGCKFYVKPPATTEEPTAVALGPAHDEVGPAPRRLGALQVALWLAAVVVAAVVIYYYGSALLAPPPTATPVAGATHSPTPSSTPSPTPTGSELTAERGAAASPTRVVAALTPTPHAGGTIYNLSPQPGAAGWVASDEARGNHLGDSYLYAGTFGGVAYHAVFQLDLRAVPRGATIYSAALELTALDARRLGTTGTWEVRILAPEADDDWSRKTFQDYHNAPVQWSLSPVLAPGDLAGGQIHTFALSGDMLRGLEQRLLEEHYTLSFRIDGPLAGEDSLFAWDGGSGPSSKGHGPRLVVDTGPAPRTPIPTGPEPPTATPIPTDTPEWFVLTSTPTPANAMTAAAVALRATALATTTGTPTPLPLYVATATPRYIVVTRTPRPANRATAAYLQGIATANVVLTGTPTPLPPNLATATFTPRPTRTPVYYWLSDPRGAWTPTPLPTTPPIPTSLKGNILFLSNRGGQGAVYMLVPSSGQVAVLTARWPYDVAMQAESLSPDGRARAFVQNDSRGVPQVYIYSTYYGGSWQVTFNTHTSYDPVWSPTGDRLAFVSNESGNDDVYLIDSDGSDQQRLTFNQWEWDKHPSWSPDGRQIVFWSNEGSGRRQLWIMNADGSGRRTLLDSRYDDWDPVWVK